MNYESDALFYSNISRQELLQMYRVMHQEELNDSATAESVFWQRSKLCNEIEKLSA